MRKDKEKQKAEKKTHLAIMRTNLTNCAALRMTNTISSATASLRPDAPHSPKPRTRRVMTHRPTRRTSPMFQRDFQNSCFGGVRFAVVGGERRGRPYVT